MLNTHLNLNPAQCREPREALEERVEAMRELERRPGAEEGTWGSGDGGAC